jgi:hypothetical protein
MSFRQPALPAQVGGAGRAGRTRASRVRKQSAARRSGARRIRLTGSGSAGRYPRRGNYLMELGLAGGGSDLVVLGDLDVGERVSGDMRLYWEHGGVGGADAAMSGVLRSGLMLVVRAAGMHASPG